MIRLEKVNKFFNRGKKNQIHVINDTTLELADTGLVALLGPSGSGKTTLLNAIGGLDRIDSGAIFIDGRKLTGRRAARVDELRNLNIGYIFQDYKLVDSMTVYENVAMVLKMIGVRDDAEIKKRCDYILERLGLYRYRNRLADMLSGGERQRVGIARALVKNPRIIIADEPTGNLDSANTIEIMNIIKAISRDRLVVLVTHETELARFYASRVIELKDGRVTADYENRTDDNLDYRLDNKLYLRDFAKHEQAAGASVKVDFYGGEEDKAAVTIVVKNGNIYIKSCDERRVEVVDQNSALEFVDDHYREIDKSLYEDYRFDFDQVADTSLKERYSSIIGLGPSLLRGFRKLASYPLMKKLLLAGFLLAGVFITYALSSIYAALDVRDEDFIGSNRDYLAVEALKVDIAAYERCEKLASVSHLFPGSAQVRLRFDLDFYYQTQNACDYVSGDLTDVAALNAEELIYGRMPQNQYELAVDLLSLEWLLAGNQTVQVGIDSAEQMLGQTLRLEGMRDFTIVGITDKTQPLIYADPALFTDMIYASLADEDVYQDVYNVYEEAGKSMYDYRTYAGAYTLSGGELPQEAYEVLIPRAEAAEHPLGSELEDKVAGHRLKVSGYYESPDNVQVLLVSEQTIKYAILEEAKGFAVAPKDAAAAAAGLQEENFEAVSAYESEREAYLSERSTSVRSAVAAGLVVLAISLIEILLMTRSSFLSRIKEIGIYRAIGVKKTDIYKMFLGEIFAITTVSSLAGIAVMSYILYHLCQIEFLTASFALNPLVVGGAIVIVYAFNAAVGLIPVFNTMRKTPAAILARYDVD